jgi:hypothetical protein
MAVTIISLPPMLTRMVGLVEQHQELTEATPLAVVADRKYGTIENMVAMAEAGIRSHMTDLRSKQRNVRTEGIYPSESFSYDTKKDAYRCPAGQWLWKHHWVESRGYSEYRTRNGECEACHLRPLCTRAKAGRTLKRYEQQKLLDRARRQAKSRAAQRDRGRRKWRMDGSFALGAVQHGMKRARWRGLWKQKVQDWLISAVQNLKTLIRRALGTASALGMGYHHLIKALQQFCHYFTVTLAELITKTFSQSYRVIGSGNLAF